METCYEIETFKIRLAVAEPELTHCRMSEDVVAICRPIFADLDADQEHFVVLLLNNKNRIRAYKVISSGSLTASIVHPREAFRPVILYGAAGIIFVHNHPAGDPAPSPEDIDLTRRLKEVGELVGVRVLDHVVLGKNSYYSFSDRGALDGSSAFTFGVNRSAPLAAPPALRPDGKKRRSDFGRPRGRYKHRTAPRKDAGIPRGPRKTPESANAAATAPAPELSQ